MENIINLLKNNQFLLAGLGISGFGLISFWFKDVPMKIFQFLKKQLTTDLIVQNYDLIFYEVLKWLQKENQNKNFRTLKICNGKWGETDELIISMGYGFHIVKYKYHFLLMNYVKESETIADRIKETITITKLGRSKKLFEEIIKKININDNNNIKLYKMDGDWFFSKNIKKRNINSLFIEKEKKDLIFNNLHNFIEKEKWYIKSGIPYQYGILLYGEPGTGKTSLIKVIASVLNYNIYYLTPSKLSEINKALNDCPEKSIIVIEDIDTNNIVNKRNKKRNDIMVELNLINFSDILNAIDGLGNVHGRLLICTTNHLEKLDKALIRPGRFDLLINIGFVNNEILRDFLKFYFSKNEINVKNKRIKKNITVADLQNMVLLGWSLKQILNKIILKIKGGIK